MPYTRLTAINFAGVRLAVLAVSLASSILIVRALSVTQYSAYAAATGIVVCSSALGALGIDQLYLLGNVSVRQLQLGLRIAAIVITALSVAAAYALPGLQPAERLTTVLLGISAAAEIARMDWLLKPQNNSRYMRRAGREAISRLATATAAVTTAMWTGSAVTTAAAIATLNVFMTLLVRHREPAQRREEKLSYGTLRSGFPYALSGALFTAYFSIDLVLLAWLGSSTAPAHYRVAMLVLQVPATIAAAINNEVFRPRLYHTHRLNDNVVGLLARQFLKLNLTLGVVALLTSILAANGLLVAVFGQGYGPSEPLLFVLAFALAPHFLNSWAGNLLIASGPANVVTRIQGCGMMFNVAVNFWAIPAHGALGAAFTTVATEFLCLLLYMVACSKGMGR